MKFSKLVGKFEKLAGKLKKGKQIQPEKLQKLQQLLSAKKSRYKEELKSTNDPEKRKKLKNRLKVVAAQLKKSEKLSTSK